MADRRPLLFVVISQTCKFWFCCLIVNIVVVLIDIVVFGVIDDIVKDGEGVRVLMLLV